MIDLDAIRARDAADMEVLPGLEAYAQHVDDEELRNAIHMVRDRRALLAHVDALAAERDALRKDAERYRWLRPRLSGSAFRGAGVFYSEGGPGIDAAIDAAMEGSHE